MACCNNIVATNAGGIPYIHSTNTTIGTETINIALGIRRIQPVGYITIIIDDVIPTDTTATLPVTLTLNDSTKALTLPNGTAVTAAELIGVSVITIFNDRTTGLLTLMSRTIA
jgi:hypothetical protein